MSRQLVACETSVLELVEAINTLLSSGIAEAPPLHITLEDAAKVDSLALERTAYLERESKRLLPYTQAVSGQFHLVHQQILALPDMPLEVLERDIAALEAENRHWHQQLLAEYDGARRRHDELLATLALAASLPQGVHSSASE